MSPVIPAGGDRDLREELLPADLLPYFDDRFVGSCDRIEEYVFRLVVGIARDVGLEAPLREGGTADVLAARIGLDPGVGVPLADWILRLLAERKVVVRTDGDRAEYRLDGALPDVEAEEIEEAQRAHDSAALPSFRLAAMAAEAYPAVMRGEIAGEAALFAADRIAAWGEYFSNDNPLYAISNVIGSRSLAGRLPRAGATVLEIGGGFGSGAMAVLDRFAEAAALERIASYRFTEIAPLFLRRGQRSLQGRADAKGRVSFGRLDIDQPLAEAGIAPGTLSAVYGVNTLHVARDLAFTLAEIRTALAPGGLVLASECMRPFPGRTVYVELVFLLLDAFRSPVLDPVWRPNGGFLTPEQWMAAFRAAGFEAPFVWPDLPSIRDHYPSFVVAAAGAFRP